MVDLMTIMVYSLLVYTYISHSYFFKLNLLQCLVDIYFATTIKRKKKSKRDFSEKNSKKNFNENAITTNQVRKHEL